MMLTRRGFIAALAAIPACASVALLPTTALADLESDLAAAEQRLSELGTQLAEMRDELDRAGSDLERTDNEIADIEIEIEETQQEIEELRGLLASRMRSSYKAGNVDIVDFVLGAGSIEEFASRIYYMDKVSENDAAAIARVKQLEFDLEQQKVELEDKREEQENRVHEVEAQVAEYEDAVAEAQAYYDQLDQELQEELARRAEEERRAAEAAAAQAAAQEQAQAQAQQTSGLVTAIETVQPSTPSQPAVETPTTTETEPTEPEPEQPAQPSTPSSSYRPAPGGGAATAIEIANMGNVPYVYGADGNQATFAFDCSGLVYYCYLGYRAGTAGTIGRAIQARGTWVTDISQLNYGDCVFTRSNFDHIGIYIGGGTMVHAPYPGAVVQYGSVTSSNFYGGGPFAT